MITALRGGSAEGPDAPGGREQLCPIHAHHVLLDWLSQGFYNNYGYYDGNLVALNGLDPTMTSETRVFLHCVAPQPGMRGTHGAPACEPHRNQHE